MYEILSNLPESVAYTCVNCTVRHPAEWRLALAKALQISLKQVLTALLNSRTTSHLLRYRQVGPRLILDSESLSLGGFTFRMVFVWVGVFSFFKKFLLHLVLLRLVI